MESPGSQTCGSRRYGARQSPVHDLTGKTAKSPRHEFWQVNDDGQIVAARYDDWKVVFLGNRGAAFGVWREPFTELRSSGPTTRPRLQIRSQDTTCESMRSHGTKPKRGRRSATAVFGLALATLAAAALSFSLTRPKPGTDASLAAVSGFLPTQPNPAPPPGPAPEGMVWIPGGEFSMGSDAACESLCGLPGVTRDAVPIHRVYVDGFWMDKTAVTDEKFEEFVKATGYLTVAERAPTREEFPTAPPENLVAGSTVFTPTPGPVPLTDHYQWWRYEKGANWRHPLGPDTDLRGKEKYPVVHIAYPDAVAYAKWVGKRLPTEAEFEFAARGGASGKTYAWGDDLKPGGKWMANIYQGRFPVNDRGEDGFAGIAPVAQFPPNGYGLFDMAGNVWQWCSDWYGSDYYAQLAKAGGVARNPQGPDAPYDPAEPAEKKRVHRGGSFLCTDQYCTRYMVGTRGKGEVTTGSNHVGFRCVQGPSGAEPGEGK